MQKKKVIMQLRLGARKDMAGGVIEAHEGEWVTVRGCEWGG